MNEQQLENWTLLIYDEMEKAQKIMDKENDITIKHATAKGFKDGLCVALSLLNCVEKGRFKNKIKKLQEKHN